MTFRAKEIISESDIIIGYETYVNLVSDLIEGKTVYRYGLTETTRELLLKQVKRKSLHPDLRTA